VAVRHSRFWETPVYRSSTCQRLRTSRWGATTSADGLRSMEKSTIFKNFAVTLLNRTDPGTRPAIPRLSCEPTSDGDHNASSTYEGCSRSPFLTVAVLATQRSPGAKIKIRFS